MYNEDLRKARAAEEAKVAEMETWLASSNFGERNAEIKGEIRRIHGLNEQAKRASAVRNIASPNEGDFRTGADGKKYRFTTRYWKKVEPSNTAAIAAAANAPNSVVNPSPGDLKKIKGKVFRWTEEPAWLQVDRKTNYNIDLADTFARYNRLGKPYLDARDQLWQIFYPDEAPIYRPAAYRRRNTRRNNRKNRRAATRKY